jgi:hypothetical protein
MPSSAKVFSSGMFDLDSEEIPLTTANTVCSEADNRR